MLFVAGNESEVLDLPVEFIKREDIGDTALAVEERQVALFFRFKVMQRNPRKIRNDDVTRDFVEAVFAGQTADIIESLRFGFKEALPEGFVFYEQNARPEQVNVAELAGDFLDRFFKAGHDAAFDAEHLEELVPEGLFFGLLARGPGPIAGKLDRVMADFVPTDRHG